MSLFKPSPKIPPTFTGFPTMIAAKTADGRFLGIDGSVWAWRAVPLAPVQDAKTTDNAIRAGEPIHAAWEELARITPVRGNRRSLVRGAYRETQALLVNIPRVFEPSQGPLHAYLRDMFPTTLVDSRVLLFGVKLTAALGTGGWRSAYESVVDSVVDGGTPLSDYDRDYQDISDALDRAGLKPMTTAEYNLGNAWWNYGKSPLTPVVYHSDHMHFFRNSNAADVATSYGADNCDNWPNQVGEQHAVTFASVSEFNLPYLDAADSMAKWMIPFIQSKALVTSIRAKVEPASITRQELRRQKKGYLDDLNSRFKEGKMDRAELDSKVEELSEVEALYASDDGAPASLIDVSVLIGFNGIRDDIERVSTDTAGLNVMLYRQQQAWAETMMCSHVRHNPNLHDLPATAVAYSGLPALNTVGDREGALVGFTESDRQPALLSPVAVAQEDTYPITVVAAAAGAGKSVMMLWLADQFARLGRPVVIIDPKMGSDHSAAVRLSGGQVASLDDLFSSDGVLDPLRFAMSPADGIDMAASMILDVNPFGYDKINFEVPLIAALNYGVSQGATCIGQALQLALQNEPNNPDLQRMVKSIFDLASAMPMFRALVGVNPSTRGLRISDGITYIKVGRVHLQLPRPNTQPEQQSIPERVALAVTRMMIFGAATAMTGRDGVILQDEAWTILNADPKEVERLGRLARSQRVLPILLSQDISGAVRAGLRGFISRGFVGPIGDPVEAKAALDLFGIEATPERMLRITSPATMDSYGQDEFAAPNWNSMKSLRDPRTREVLRGSVWLYSDLAGRVIPVECVLPPEFLKVATTNAVDHDKREAELALQKA